MAPEHIIASAAVMLIILGLFSLLIKGFLVDVVETITNKKIKQFFLNKLDKEINEFK